MQEYESDSGDDEKLPENTQTKLKSSLSYYPKESQQEDYQNLKRLKLSQTHSYEPEIINDLNEFRDEVAEFKKLFPPEFVR